MPRHRQPKPPRTACCGTAPLACTVHVDIARVADLALARAAAAEAVPGLRTWLDTDAEDSFAVVVASASATALDRRLRRNAHTQTEAGHAIGARALMPAHSFIGSEISYIKDYHVELLGPGKVELHPETGTVRDGCAVEAIVGALDDRRLRLALSVTHGDVPQPLPTFETSLAGKDDKLVLHLPTVTIRTGGATCTLEDDESVVMAWDATDGWVRVAIARIQRMTIPATQTR